MNSIKHRVRRCQHFNKWYTGSSVQVHHLGIWVMPSGLLGLTVIQENHEQVYQEYWEQVFCGWVFPFYEHTMLKWTHPLLFSIGTLEDLWHTMFFQGHVMSCMNETALFRTAGCWVRFLTIRSTWQHFHSIRVLAQKEKHSSYHTIMWYFHFKSNYSQISLICHQVLAL